LPRKTGALRALGAAVLFGASTPAAKGLLGNIHPQVLAGLLYLGSGAGLTVLWLLGRNTGSDTEAALAKGDIPWLSGAILFGGVLAPLVVLMGLSQTPASASSLLLNLEGVFTALIAWIVFSENVDRRIALGMFAIVTGGAVLSWSGRLAWGGVSGPLLIVLGCLFWGVDNNLSQKVSAKDPVQIAAIKGAVAGFANLGIGLTAGGAIPKLTYLGVALVVGFLSYGLSLVLYILAMREVGTARTGAYFSLAPFVGAAISLAVWHERVATPFIIAGALMAAGLWLHLTERHYHTHVHEPITHTHQHVHDAHHQHEHVTGEGTEEPHSHEHTHEGMVHAHEHFPDAHHRHAHDEHASN
jgi:drug/metabolite transporter (DMT)-like permease